MKKIILAAVLLITVALVLSGCGGTKVTASEKGPAAYVSASLEHTVSLAVNADKSVIAAAYGKDETTSAPIHKEDTEFHKLSLTGKELNAALGDIIGVAEDGANMKLTLKEGEAAAKDTLVPALKAELPKALDELCKDKNITAELVFVSGETETSLWKYPAAEQEVTYGK